MLVATWNVNSIRLRIPQLKNFLKSHQPDFIALQETKVQDHEFPMADLQALGYPYILFKGQKSYNGVALLSKYPMTPGPTANFGGMGDSRHISCMLPNGGVLHNFYVPAGGDVPDLMQNKKYAHKINFLQDMKKILTDVHAPDQPIIVVGDINIAPRENDVWSHKPMLKVVCHTPLETENLGAVMGALGVFDCARHFVPDDKKLYSWWSYRNHEISEASRGLRLDHIWLRERHRDRLKSCVHLAKQRLEDKPSDHVVVMAEFDW
ncbi:MAG: exodeoxyribonuclease III [Hydrotalea sp.]|nr:exodeoxyribonuclease III [Hydrotalea sp.]